MKGGEKPSERQAVQEHALVAGVSLEAAARNLALYRGHQIRLGAQAPSFQPGIYRDQAQSEERSRTISTSAIICKRCNDEGGYRALSLMRGQTTVSSGLGGQVDLRVVVYREDRKLSLRS